MNAGGYIGRKVEGGGTIYFDYAIGFKGDVTVAKKSNLHSYHVDYARGGVVVCDDPSDTSKTNRFYVVILLLNVTPAHLNCIGDCFVLVCV